MAARKAAGSKKTTKKASKTAAKSAAKPVSKSVSKSSRKVSTAKAPRTTKKAPRKAPAKVAAIGPEPTFDQISLRAFQIWQRNGRHDGHDHANWKQAEAELRAERGLV
jgi:hypothetical protein